MVSNFERILVEIQKEANRIAPTYDLQPDLIVKLIMEIVDLEDQHRVKAKHNINILVEEKIRNSVAHSSDRRKDVIDSAN